MKIKFVTTNKHKVREISAILAPHNIELEQVDIEYPEDKEASMQEVVESAVGGLANELGAPVMVEDTGCFFTAYDNFPGAQPKFVYNSLGFKGILKLLEGEDRRAYFETWIGYAEPDSKVKSFSGRLDGAITEEVISPEKETLPYNHIFIADGQDRAVVDMSLKDWNAISQRNGAAQKLAQYLANKN